jgi:hypothetical protein
VTHNGYESTPARCGLGTTPCLFLELFLRLSRLLFPSFTAQPPAHFPGCSTNAGRWALIETLIMIGGEDD